MIDCAPEARVADWREFPNSPLLRPANGFPADSGYGCVFDESARPLVQERLATNSEDLYVELKALLDDGWQGNTWAFAEYHFSPQLNMLLFSTGWGDGMCDAYFGYAETDAVVRVILDFSVIDLEALLEFGK